MLVHCVHSLCVDRMEEITDYDGSGLELVHLSDVLDYLGEDEESYFQNINLISIQLQLNFNLTEQHWLDFTCYCSAWA